MIRAHQLSKSYWQSGQEIRVLQDVDLELKAGESLAIVGASGVGKSTLLHCLGLLDEFDRGELEIAGVQLSSIRTKEVPRIRQEKIGFVFQFHYLMAELTALENVMIPLLIAGRERSQAESMAAGWLDRVGLAERLSHRPSQLSGGEQQRVAIARALVREPKLIIADEPTGNLDPQTANEVFDVLVKRSLELGAVFIMATHNLELSKRLNKTATLLQGHLV